MRIALALVTIAMMAGCGQSGDGGNGAASATGASGAPATGGGGSAAAVTMQPGQWESRAEVVNVGSPQLPPGATVPGVQPIVTRHCLTPQQAANPNAQTLTSNPVSTGCTTGNLTFANGRIAGSAVCEVRGGTVQTTIEGQFTATSYEMTVKSRAEMGGTTTNSEMRVTARRLGDCPAG